MLEELLDEEVVIELVVCDELLVVSLEEDDVWLLDELDVEEV